MNETTAISGEHREKKSQFLWTAMICGFFLIQAVIWAFALSVTFGDRSHAVVSSYAEKALHWDQEKAAILASERLGWSVRIVVDPSADVRGNRTVLVTLADENDQPVTNATVRMEAFHRGLAAEVHSLGMSEIGDGVYSGNLQIRKSGQWQFKGEVNRAVDVRLIDQQLRIVASR